MKSVPKSMITSNWNMTLFVLLGSKEEKHVITKFMNTKTLVIIEYRM